MSFCDRDYVVDLTGTTLNDDIHGQQTMNRIIAASDRKINRMLKQGGLSANPAPTPDDIKDASAFYSAAGVLRRHRVDGTIPEDYTIDGKIRGKINISKAITDYETEGNRAVQMYIEENVQDSDYSTFHVVGSQGERVGDYETMTEAQEDET